MRRLCCRKSSEECPRLEGLEPRLLLDGGAGETPIGYDPSWLRAPQAGAEVVSAGAAAAPAGSNRTWSGVLDVYVEPGLLGQIQYSLDTYTADLAAEGYTVAVQEWSGTAAELRDHLRARYETADLEGALLIGDLPVVEYTNANDFGGGTETFVHDLYFMDLDGTYVFRETDPDQHLDGSGDVEPEIYVSRITPSGVEGLLGSSEAKIINRYFSKVHAYRTGQATYENRGVLWSDDDWKYTTYHMGGDALYEEILNVRDPAETTRQNYLDTLAMNYESVLFMSHSNVTYHAITGVGGGRITSADIVAANPRAAFYNLWNCSSASFNEPDNLIGAYVYGSDYALNAVGTTKTGAMLDTRQFYAYQGEGMSVGQAFQSWWDAVGVGTPLLRRWLYGMTMQGDPTLRPATMGEPQVTADAGPDRIVRAGQTVLLDGSASEYPHGGEVSWRWEQLAGPDVVIDGGDGPAATFRVPADGTYVFRLTLQAGSISDSDEVTFRTRDPDLLLWWGFDDGSGGTAADLSGSGRNGAVSGATWDPAGRVGGALRFDGDDFVSESSAAAWLNGLDELTVSLWIRSDEIGTDRGFLTTRDPAGPDPADGLLLRYSDRGALGRADDILTAGLRTTGGTHTVEGTWYGQRTDWQHVAMTWTSGGAIVLYVDGRPQRLTYDGGALGGLTAGVETLRVGQADAGGWRGLIDDVRIYSRALAAGEIAQQANLDPVAADDAWQIGQDTPLVVSAEEGLLANDTDPDGGPSALSAEVIDGPAHGQLEAAADGAFTYTPAEGFVGTDRFSYRASDGLEYSGIATATITVRDTVAPVVTAAEVDPLTGEMRLEFSEPVGLSKTDMALLDASGVLVDLTDVPLDSPPGAAAASLAFGERPAAGYYRLLLRSDRIVDSWGNALDGDGDGQAGGFYQATLLVPLAGDATLDGQVDFRDVLRVKWSLAAGGTGWTGGDFDGDGQVRRHDLDAVVGNFGLSLQRPEPWSGGSWPGERDPLPPPPGDAAPPSWEPAPAGIDAGGRGAVPAAAPGPAATVRLVAAPSTLLSAGPSRRSAAGPARSLPPESAEGSAATGRRAALEGLLDVLSLADVLPSTP